MSENAKWYVIHTYSGYENAVKTSIEKFVNGRGMEDMILRMEIPVELVPPRPTSLQHRSLHLASRQRRNTVSTFRPKNRGTK